jgi:small subunit ribosomal protein S16
MRMGKTKQPSYRIVVKEARTPRSGRYIELLGHYNPLTEPADVKLDEERLKYWLGVGAQPTDVMKRLISKHTSVQL